MRIDAEAALDLPRRQEVLAAVEAEPGLSFRRILDLTGIPAGTGMHHVQVLKRTGHVEQHRLGSRLAFYPPGLSEAQKRLCELRDEGLAAVYQIVVEAGPCCQKAALDAARMPRSSAQHRLGRLVRLGLVACRPVGRRLVYEVAA